MLGGHLHARASTEPHPRTASDRLTCMPRALITGVSGQDGSYLAERLLADGVEVHAVSLPDDAPVDGVRTHVGDVADVEGTRAAGPRGRARRDLQPGRGQLGRALLGRARAHRPRQRPRRGRAARVGPPAAGARGPPGAVRPGVQRGDLRPPRPVPAGRGDPGPPGEPVRRREGLRPPDGRRLPTPGPARGQPGPLQPRVTAPARAVRDPQDHRRRGRDLRRHRLAAHPRQPRRRARLGLGPGLRRRDGARRPRRRPPRLRGGHRREPLGGGVRRRGVPLRRHRRLGVVRRRRPGAVPSRSTPRP